MPLDPPLVYEPMPFDLPEWSGTASGDKLPWYTGWGRQSIWQEAWEEGFHHFPSATVLIQDLLERPPSFPQNLDAPLAVQTHWLEQDGEPYLGIGLQAPQRPAPKLQIHIVAEGVRSQLPHLSRQLQTRGALAVFEEGPTCDWREKVNFENVEAPWEEALRHLARKPALAEKEIVCWMRGGSYITRIDAAVLARFKDLGVRLTVVNVANVRGTLIRPDDGYWDEQLYLSDERDLKPLFRYLERSHLAYLHDLDIQLELLSKNGRWLPFSSPGNDTVPPPRDFPYEGYSLTLLRSEEVATPLRLRLRLRYKDDTGANKRYRWKGKLAQAQPLSDAPHAWQLLWALSRYSPNIENGQQGDWAEAPLEPQIRTLLRHYEQRLLVGE